MNIFEQLELEYKKMNKCIKMYFSFSNEMQIFRSTVQVYTEIV